MHTDSATSVTVTHSLTHFCFIISKTRMMHTQTVYDICFSFLYPVSCTMGTR